jgi:hypothetical protein
MVVTKYFVRHASRKTLTAVHIAVQDLVITRESQMSRYHPLYYEPTTFVKLPATRRLFLHGHMAVMRVRGGANLNCTFQTWEIF